jgi:hypothetical protein
LCVALLHCLRAHSFRALSHGVAHRRLATRRGASPPNPGSTAARHLRTGVGAVVRRLRRGKVGFQLVFVAIYIVRAADFTAP